MGRGKVSGRENAQLGADALTIARSGFQNKLRVTEKIAFARHPGAWNDNISYFGHPVP